MEALKEEKFIYFFVGERTKHELLNSFTEILRNDLNMNYLNFSNFREFFNFLFDYSKQNKLILVLDEFQNFYKIDKWVFSDLQYFWDLNNQKWNIKLFCLGSHFTLMKEIFEDYKNPLFWRKTSSFYLKSFSVDTQVKVLDDYKKLSSINLLYFYSIFYWIPKYIDIFLKWLNYEKDLINCILDNFIKENSFFFFEWKELFLIEFWKSYDTYFSILASISLWKNRKWEIAQFSWISIDSLWFYLQKLESYFEIIERKHSIWDKKTSKVSFYSIKDNFLIFWFRYIYKYNYLIETKQTEELKKIVKKDINIFLWFSLEKLFKEILINKNLEKESILPFKFEYIDPLFNKKGEEIDLVLLNKSEKKILFLESKLNNKKISSRLLFELKEKIDFSHFIII